MRIRSPQSEPARSGFRPEGLRVRTADGGLVRSNAERVLADEMSRAGLRFSYERRLVAPDGSWRRPDFTIWDAAGRPWFVEYLGMLDVPQYRARVVASRRWYQRWYGGRVMYLTGRRGVRVEARELAEALR